MPSPSQPVAFSSWSRPGSSRSHQKEGDLITQIHAKKSFLCIGLDVDLNKIPQHLLATEDPIFEFNKAIIDATHHLCVAYKPNTAFYEAYGLKGWKALEKTINYLWIDLV